jgi:hypothetical protein
MSAAVSSLPSESKQALRLQWRRRRREALPPVEPLLQRRARKGRLEKVCNAHLLMPALSLQHDGLAPGFTSESG